MQFFSSPDRDILSTRTPSPHPTERSLAHTLLLTWLPSMHWCGCQGNTEVQTDAAVIAPGYAEEARARPKRSWQTSLRLPPLGLYFPESEWNQHRVKVFRFYCVRGLRTLGLSCVKLCKEASKTGRSGLKQEGKEQVR